MVLSEMSRHLTDSFIKLNSHTLQYMMENCKTNDEPPDDNNNNNNKVNIAQTETHLLSASRKVSTDSPLMSTTSRITMMSYRDTIWGQDRESDIRVTSA